MKTSADLVQALVAKGVVIPAPEQIFIDPSVETSRIFPGCTLYPGTRLTGAKTLIAPGARIGTLGPVLVSDSILAADVEVASGSIEGAVILPDAEIGPNAHIRPGTLIEEKAAIAHTVGLKQTILLAFSVLGSLINFCDVLLYGGRSRADHSEVGSGSIHFNFTPWGKKGDKATASLIGDVVNGVFLDQDRIFVGGLVGLVGPRLVGFGGLVPAGTVLRTHIKVDRLTTSDETKALLQEKSKAAGRFAEKIALNKNYIEQLVALKLWYGSVRKKAATQEAWQPLVIDEALSLLESCLQERMKRLNDFAAEHRQEHFQFAQPTIGEPPAKLAAGLGSTYTDAVKALAPAEVAALKNWLTEGSKLTWTAMKI